MRTYFDYPRSAGLSDAVAPSGPAHSTFLARCDKRGWSALRRHSTVERVRGGELLVRQGDTDRSLFVVLSGALVTQAPRRSGLGTSLLPGDVFGEIVFFDGLPQPWSVVAVEDSHVVRVHFETFEVLAAHEPALARNLLMDLGRVMALRVRAAEGT